MDLRERTEIMVQKYGEVCTRAAACRILGRSLKTVAKMISDGRIETACAGSMVDVRSIAKYITQPRLEDFEAKKRRMKLKYNSEYVV